VLAKFCGNKAKIFNSKIKKRTDKVKREFPFLNLIVKSVSFFILLERDKKNHFLFVVSFRKLRKNIRIVSNIKKEENFKDEEEGSNIEKRLFIIFNFCKLKF